MSDAQTRKSRSGWVWLAPVVLVAIGSAYAASRWLPFGRSAPTPVAAPQTDAIERMLPAADAQLIRGLVGSLVNPTESAAAAGQLRQHMEQLIAAKADSAPLSMAFAVQCLAPKFPSLDTPTRRLGLALLADVLGWFEVHETSCWTMLLPPAKRLLGSAMADPSRDVQLRALEIVRACWEWAPPNIDSPAMRKTLGSWKAELHVRCVELTRSSDAQVRAAAGVAVVSAPIDSEAARGLALLNDGSPAVRRAMLLALSDRQELLTSEDVLTMLRDPSSGVRAAADLVLTGRGLSREQIALATRATDPSPLVRAEAPKYIVDSVAVDRVVWLTQLSQDVDATVRAEAARALGRLGGDECIDRLREMALADSDVIVRELAGKLLEQTDRPAATSSGNSTTRAGRPAAKQPRAN